MTAEYPGMLRSLDSGKFWLRCRETLTLRGRYEFMLIQMQGPVHQTD